MVVVLALIVVFQQDLRRAFEQLAASDFLCRARRSGISTQTVDTLVEAIAAMAENRTGALLVLSGRETLDRHVRGGLSVDALISLPLLHSIFHPQSPGHDGAVLIEGERITKLGVHLPLTSNLAKIHGRGTRHAAALGLAERCDAIVIAVSEERGTISIAEQGELKEIESSGLTPKLQKYYDEYVAPHKRRVRHRDRIFSAGLKVVALTAACLLWIMFAYRIETLQRTFIVPIEYRNLPANWVIEDPRPTRVELTLTGSEREFDVLGVGNLTVSFDLSNVRSESTYRLRTEPSLRNVPPELDVTQIRPSEVVITVRRKPNEP